MKLPVVRTSLTIKIYIIIYVLVLPFFSLTVIGVLGQSSSLVEEISWWLLLVYTFGMLLSPIWITRYGFPSLKFSIDEHGVSYISASVPIT
jgi:hypothetical protein